VNKPTMNEQLDKVLDAFDQKQHERKQVQNETRSREDAFLAQFSTFRTIVAHPLFEQVGNHLRSRGHDFDISQQDYELQHDGKTRDASISLNIYPSGVERNLSSGHGMPHFSVIASRSSRTVRLHGSNMMPGHGGSAGGRGEFKLEQLTNEILQKELVSLLAEVFTK